jgi:hypothetical protein
MSLTRLRAVTLAFATVTVVAGCRAIAAYKSMAPTTAADSVETTLFLLGDAGDPGIPGHSSLDGLRHATRGALGNVVVAFLGDNAYPNGLPDSANAGRAEAEERLDAQVSAVRDSKARGIFIPGNHDWGSREDTGSSAIRREAEFVTRRGKGAIEMLPADGCPGPSVVDVGDGLRLILLDTEWWLQRSSNDASSDSKCAARNERDVIKALGKALESAGDRHTVVAAHHPLISGGAHGGHFGWRDHIFPLRDYSSWLWLPLPALGSAYPMMRERGLWLEDASNSANRRMRVAMDSVFFAHPPLVYAAGHEHNLQVLDGAIAKFLLVSGAGSQGMLNPVFRLPGTRFARQATGFMRLDVMRDGRVRLVVLTVDNRGAAIEAYAMWLT